MVTKRSDVSIYPPLKHARDGEPLPPKPDAKQSGEETGAGVLPAGVSTTRSSTALVTQPATADWKESPLAQLVGGFLGGLCLGGVPFAGAAQQLLEATGVTERRNADARLGLAIGQIIGGGLATAAGVVGDIGGGALSLSGFGAVIGVPVIAGSTVVAAGGVANVLAGVAALSTTGSGSGGAKRGPKTDPDAPHNAKVRAEAARLKAEGNEILYGGGEKPEKLIFIKDGAKSGRRPDIIYRTPDGTLRGLNVGRTLTNGSPVPREVEALDDLNGSGDLPTDFVPYDR